MLTVCFIALLAGMFLGYVSIRAIGWLIVLIFPVLAFADMYDKTHVKVINNSSSNCWVGGKSTGWQSGSPTWSGLGGVTAHTTFTGSSMGNSYNSAPWTVTYGIQTSSYPPNNFDLGNVSIQKQHDGTDTEVVITWNGDVPPEPNICWAALHFAPTDTMHPYVIYVSQSSGQGILNYPPIFMGSGRTFDLTVTNNIGGTGPGMGCPFALEYLITQEGHDPWTGSTNSQEGYVASPPGGGGSTGGGSGGSGNDNTTNAPVPGPTGTNTLTKNDLNSLIDAINMGFSIIDGTLRGVAKESTQQGTTNLLGQIKAVDTSILNQLTGISANTSNLNVTASNILDTVRGPYLAMSNWLSTNGWDYSSNAAYGEGLYVSNGLVAGVLSRSSGLFSVTDQVAQVTEADRDIWKFPIRTNVHPGLGIGPISYIDLNPLHSRAAPLFDWVRTGIGFTCEIFVFLYMVRRIQEEMIGLIRIPGSGIGKMSLQTAATMLYTFIKSNAVMGSMLLFTIVFATGALDNLLSHMGGWISHPFSAAVVSAAGDCAPALRAGLEVIEAMFPLYTVGLCLVLIFLFDLTLTGHVVFAGRVIRALTE